MEISIATIKTLKTEIDEAKKEYEELRWLLNNLYKNKLSIMVHSRAAIIRKLEQFTLEEKESNLKYIFAELRNKQAHELNMDLNKFSFRGIPTNWPFQIPNEFVSLNGEVKITLNKMS